MPKEAFNASFRDAEVLVFRSGISLNADILATAEKLRLIVRAGSGMDNIDLDYVKRRGLVFERIPRPGARAVAELSLAMMFAMARNLFTADRMWRAGRWVKYDLDGFLLEGKTLGIVGAGNIGSMVGHLGVALGMKVTGCVQDLSPDIGALLRSIGIEPMPFREVVEGADFVSIHVPLSSTTRGLFDDRVLRSMKRGSFLVNLARGGVVDEQALHGVLTSGVSLAGAALDVHAAEGDGNISPLAGLPNVILTPHIGAQTVDSQRQIGQEIIRIVEAFSGNHR
jgi:phosphoglycerate dehydrogenase-like enzyme